MKPYCIDEKKRMVTKFDCSCSPSGMNRYEFACESDDPTEILKKAKEVLSKFYEQIDDKPLTLCEHFKP